MNLSQKQQSDSKEFFLECHEKYQEFSNTYLVDTSYIEESTRRWLSDALWNFFIEIKWKFRNLKKLESSSLDFSEIENIKMEISSNLEVFSDVISSAVNALNKRVWSVLNLWDVWMLSLETSWPVNKVNIYREALQAA